jgi:hypothetical protein
MRFSADLKSSISSSNGTVPKSGVLAVQTSAGWMSHIRPCQPHLNTVSAETSGNSEPDVESRQPSSLWVKYYEPTNQIKFISSRR